MAGVPGKRRQPPRRAARADPESARRSKREREEARAAKLPPVSVLSTPTLTVETMHLSLAYNLRTRKVFVPDDEKPGTPVYTKREQHTYDTSSQTPACQEGTIEAALEHYNRFHELILKQHLFAVAEFAKIGSFILPLEDTEVLRLHILLMLKMKRKNRVLKPLRASFDLWVCKMQK